MNDQQIQDNIEAIQDALEEAWNQQAEQQQRLYNLNRSLGSLKVDLQEHLPPFKAGDRVRPKTGNRSGVGTVTAVDRAFGQWLAMVEYPRSTQTYTYPASALVKVDF